MIAVLSQPKHGGRRQGAGRPPTNFRPGVSHLRRAHQTPGKPIHVTTRVRPEVLNLRAQRMFKPLKRAFAGARAQFGFRLVHFAVMGNHMHFIVEAEDTRALTRGMQALNIRAARALNRAISEALGRRRTGKVFSDRYHARQLVFYQHVKRALEYLRYNFRKHEAEWALAKGEPVMRIRRRRGAGMLVALNGRGIHEDECSSWLHPDATAPPKSTWLKRATTELRNATLRPQQHQTRT